MNAAPVPTRGRRRRRWPYVVLAAVAVLSFAVWRVANDSDRLTAFLLSQARERFALDIELAQPAQFEFVPALALRLDGVSAHAVGSMEILFTAKTFNARLPWRVLWSGTVEIDGLEVTAPTLYAQPLAEWFAIVSAASDGPPSPLRWPRVASLFRVREARLVGADGAALLGPFDITFSHLEAGTPWQPEIAWHMGTHAFEMTPRAIAQDTVSGLALEGLEAALIARGGGDANTASTVNVSGRIGFDSAAAWAIDLHVVSEHWPTWLPALPTAVAGAGTSVVADAAASTQAAAATASANASVSPAAATNAPANDATDLTLRIVNGGASAMAIVADGTLAGTRISTSLVGGALPDFSQPLPALLDDFARHWRGRASIPALRIGDVAIEGLSIEAAADEIIPGAPHASDAKPQ
jgi:hypothetical protein